MKKCEGCQREIETDFEYCPYCGEKQVVIMNETNEKTLNWLDRLTNYFIFLYQNTKHPVLPTRVFGEKYYGIITYVMVVLLTGFGLSSGLTGLGFIIHGRSFPLLKEFLLWLALGFLVDVVLIYFLYRILLKEELSIWHAFSKLFHPISVTFYFSVLLLMLAHNLGGETSKLIFIIYLILIILTLTLVKFSFVGNVWTAPRHQGKINGVYLMMIVLTLGVILQTILFLVFAPQILEDVLLFIEEVIKNRLGHLYQLFYQIY